MALRRFLGAGALPKGGAVVVYDAITDDDTDGGHYRESTRSRPGINRQALLRRFSD